MHQQRALRQTLVAIVASIVGLAVLAWFDTWREEEAALAAFADEQSIIAQTLAGHLEERLDDVRRDAFLIAEAAKANRPPSITVLSSYLDVRLRSQTASRLTLPPPSTSFVLSVDVPDGQVVDLALPQASFMTMLSRLERPPTQIVLLWPPAPMVAHLADPSASEAARSFRAVDGRLVSFAPLAEALRSGSSSLELTRPQADSLGLSRRIAYAGLASVDAGDLGRWGLAIIVSAERLRDREARARVRLSVGVLTAGGLVAAFGALALRRQRRELELSRELAVAAVERDHDARLDQAARAATLGTLAMGIAHEISTPANVIHGRAEQLAPRVLNDERAKAAVQAITDQAARISQVVRGFLDLARGNAQAAEPVDAEELVEGALALVEHRFTKARVSLSRDAVGRGAGDALPRVRGDRRLLEHALTNLLLNACDACDAGGHVEVQTSLNGGMVDLAVLDDGEGISPADAAHVMEPFFTTKEAGKGTGLGLAITSEIVRAHRGVLRLEPRTPRGTRAVISLPVHDEVDAAEASARNS